MTASRRPLFALAVLPVVLSLAGCDPGDRVMIRNDHAFPIAVSYTQTYKAFGGPMTTQGKWGRVPARSAITQGKVAHNAPFTVIARNPQGVVVGTVVCPVRKPRRFSVRFGPGPNPSAKPQTLPKSRWYSVTLGSAVSLGDGVVIPRNEESHKGRFYMGSLAGSG